jgi:hypothetical protein
VNAISDPTIRHDAARDMLEEFYGDDLEIL